MSLKIISWHFFYSQDQTDLNFLFFLLDIDTNTFCHFQKMDLCLSLVYSWLEKRALGRLWEGFETYRIVAWIPNKQLITIDQEQNPWSWAESANSELTLEAGRKQKMTLLFEQRLMSLHLAMLIREKAVLPQKTHATKFARLHQKISDIWHAVLLHSRSVLRSNPLKVWTMTSVKHTLLFLTSQVYSVYLNPRLAAERRQAMCPFYDEFSASVALPWAYVVSGFFWIDKQHCVHGQQSFNLQWLCPYGSGIKDLH